MLKINIDGLSFSKTISLFSFLLYAESGGMVLKGLFVYLFIMITDLNLVSKKSINVVNRVLNNKQDFYAI